MNLSKIAQKVRKKIVILHHKTQASHIGSSFSCVDILVALYLKVLRINRNNLKSYNRDRFILSKGHAASALYCTLNAKGLLTEKALKKYCCNGSFLSGHASQNFSLGIDISTGSLGHGLPIGAGMAYAGKYDKKRSRIFVLMSDGECDEGSVWEAAMFASHHKLDNLIAIIDYNKIQANGYVKDVLSLESLKDKWQAFGWSVKEINGHSFDSILAVFKKIPFKKNSPSLVIAHTIKGKGVSFMENKLQWHYKSPNANEAKLALEEIHNEKCIY